jgi:hypothetical protein
MRAYGGSPAAFAVSVPSRSRAICACASASSRATRARYAPEFLERYRAAQRAVAVAGS